MKISCPKCHTESIHPDHMAGELVTCTKCGHIVRAPKTASVVKRQESSQNTDASKKKWGIVVAASILAAILACALWPSPKLLIVSIDKNWWSKSDRNNPSSYEDRWLPFTQKILRDGGCIGIIDGDMIRALVGTSGNVSVYSDLFQYITDKGWRFVQADGSDPHNTVYFFTK